LNPVWITDATVVTALGNSLSGTWKKLIHGKTGIRPVNRFSVHCESPKIAACIQDLSPKGPRSLIHQLIDQLLVQLPPVPPDTLLITASTKGGIDNLEHLIQGHTADANDILLSTLPNTVAKKLGLHQNGFNVSAACASSTVAVAQGVAWVASGRRNSVLIICADLVTEFVYTGFSALQILSPTPCRPFDRNRSGLSLGEGAAAILIMDEHRAKKEHRKCLAKIAGCGIAGDASHLTAPARDGRGLVQAMGQAMKEAGLNADSIDAVHAHGTGTVYNDQMELTAFDRVFGTRKFPIYSVKGAIGHTLGAAGGIELALTIKSLSEQLIPPTAGLLNPEEGAAGRLKPAPCSGSLRYIFSTNSGFGGTNAAIILEQGSHK
jgi:3-oxoacyl-[acyl-carrier-protein] synthase II